MKTPNKAEVKALMEKYELSEEQAIQLWLEDNDELENEEIEEMTKKAKANKIGAKADSKKHTNKKPRTVKISNEKQELFSDIVEYLSDFYDLTVLKPNKLVEITVNDKVFKLDLIETRQKKGT